ncbi:MAG: GntR family transcriptional regulator [Paracoccaceae bacterium]
MSQELSVGDSVYEALRRDIIFGRLAPSAKLKLDQLKADYSASIATIREALNRLVTEGFVVTEGQRGFFVGPMSAAGLREIADLRILLECHALKLSFEAGDTEWEARVIAAHHKLSRMEQRMQAGDHSVKEVWKQYDWEFHQALISGCGSEALLNVHGTVFDKYLRYQMHTLTFRGDPAAIEHRSLLDSAMARDIEKAQLILRQHIEGGVEHSLEQNAQSNLSL